MLASSLAVVLLGAALFLGALVAFGWALLSGKLERLDEQSVVVLDPEDLRIDRPWETPEQRRERRRRHGPLVEPRPGEWGGTW
jgi:hypothetical protein